MGGVDFKVVDGVGVGGIDKGEVREEEDSKVGYHCLQCARFHACSWCFFTGRHRVIEQAKWEI